MSSRRFAGSTAAPSGDRRGSVRTTLATWVVELAPALLAESDAIRWALRDPAQ